MKDLYDIKESAREELRERCGDDAHLMPDPGDLIHEIADGAVPIYTADLMALAAEHISLATDEPELGPAFDGRSTPVNIVAANVYEAVCNDLWAYFSELSEESEERADAETDEEYRERALEDHRAEMAEAE